MSATSDDSGQWQPCPPGEIGRMANRLQRTRRLSLIPRADRRSPRSCSSASLASTCEVAVSLARLNSGEFDYGGITCTEIHRVLPGLKAGTLDDETLARVREHIEKCPLCKAFSNFLPNSVQTGGLPSRDPDCGGCARNIVAK